MARHLACDTMTILAFEIGEQSPEGNSRKKLIEILQTAESCRARVQRRAMAEVIMRDRGLQQIHDTDLTACLDEAFKKNI